MPRGLPLDRVPKRHGSDMAAMASMVKKSPQQNDAANILFRSVPIGWWLLFVLIVINTFYMASISMNHQEEVVWVVSTNDGHDDRTSSRLLHAPPLESDSSVMVVLVSNRLDGMVGTISSILVNTVSRGVDLVVIGDAELNEKIRQRFLQPQGQRTQVLNSFISLTVPDVEADLIAQGHSPIWTWKEWHSSMSSKDWFRPNSTLHAAEWDHLPTHAHKLNHLRFYLPYMTMFQERKHFYFIDDDILIRKDLGIITDETLPNLHGSKGIVTPCNIWMWDSTCQTFQFLNETTIGSILDMPSLYGDRRMCGSASEEHCYPEHYPEFLHRVLPNETPDNPHPDRQPAWNFGFSLFQLDNWKRENLTSRYEDVMRASYKEHVFPETSLSFGLGVAYLSFAGAVQCWDDTKVRVRDGFGFIEHSRFEKSFGANFMDDVDVIHYTGPTKPWKPNTTIEPASLQPWLETLKYETYPIPQQISDVRSTDIVVVLGGERSGTQWLMDILDRHPAVCAGEHGRPETGFSPDSLMPSKLTWLPLCSTRRSCSFEYIYNAVLDLQATLDPRGRYATYPARCQRQNQLRDPLRENLPRICNFFKALNGNFSDSSIENLWLEAFRMEDDKLLGCTCPRGTRVKALKVMPNWIASDERPEMLTLGALNGSKSIRMTRGNLLDRYISREVASQTSIYKISSATEEKEQRRQLKSIELSPKQMIATIRRWVKDDRNADNWAVSKSLDVMDVNFEQCVNNLTSCIEKICSFLGVESSRFASKIKKQSFRRGTDSSYIDFISNREEIRRELNRNQMSEYIVDW